MLSEKAVEGLRALRLQGRLRLERLANSTHVHQLLSHPADNLR